MRQSLLIFAFLALCPALFSQGLDNEGIIKLTKAGMSNDVILSTIDASEGQYDTSANGLNALKSAGVSSRVISALISKASGAAAPSTAPTEAASAPPLPTGMNDVGVYYKDKSGKWILIIAETINFKTDGLTKTSTAGSKMQDNVDGYIQGPHAKVSAIFPVLIAVYVPEGTAITEYELLRFTAAGKQRDFHARTGNVIHISGSAARNVLETQSERIAPGIYEIRLDSSLGRGEYGLLPPGSHGSPNMGSNGKIYSISITE